MSEIKKNSNHLAELAKWFINTAPRVLIYGLIGTAIGVGANEALQQADIGLLDNESNIVLITPMLIGLIVGFARGTYKSVVSNK